VSLSLKSACKLFCSCVYRKAFNEKSAGFKWWQLWCRYNGLPEDSARGVIMTGLKYGRWQAGGPQF
jgi:hypothetical protein